MHYALNNPGDDRSKKRKTLAGEATRGRARVGQNNRSDTKFSCSDRMRIKVLVNPSDRIKPDPIQKSDWVEKKIFFFTLNKYLSLINYTHTHSISKSKSKLTHTAHENTQRRPSLPSHLTTATQRLLHHNATAVCSTMTAVADCLTSICLEVNQPPPSWIQAQLTAG